MTYFRSVFKDKLSFNPLFGLVLILFLGIPRFIIVLHANATANYNYTSLIFVFMWILPFILLNRKGRRHIGLRKTKKPRSLVYSFLIGIVICIPVFLLGYLLYGTGDSNWFVYISRSYSGGLPKDLTYVKHLYFAIFALISMVFSPIGEELMYRGLIHQSFEGKYGPKKASEIDSTAFALTHLAHFGILFTASGWIFRPMPAFLWVVCTFFVSRVFFFCKQRSDSLLGAILCHAGFNLAMTYFIFYFIL